MTSFQDLTSLAGSFPTNSPINDDGWEKLIASIPDDFGYEEVLIGLEYLGHTNSRATLLAVLAYLRKNKPERVAQDEASISRLCDYVATAIAPCWTPKGEDDQDAEPPSYEEMASLSRETGPYGLEILDMLTRDHPPEALHNSNLLLTLISFTDPPTSPESWTTPETRALATSILGRQLLSSASSAAAAPSDHHHQQEDLVLLVVDIVLKTYLRPLFSKSRPATVTSSGRRAAFQGERDPLRGLGDETAAVKPWKYADHRAIPALHFAVRKAEESLISKQWPLFVPVILALLDDTTTRIRCRGLIILNDFLSKFPSHILRDTGLASVFEDAVFPTLHFLPSITPETESTQLLVPAYSALLALAGKVDKKPKTGKHYYGDAPRTKLLDKILREGIFSSYFHVKENVRIVDVLAVQTARILNEMGIYAVKHLKDLIPMHSEIMAGPFAALAPLTLLAAIKSLQATITNCWPRLSTPAYQSELIKALVVCFLTIQDDQDKLDGTQFSAIEAELTKTVAMLSAVTKTGGGEWEGKGDSSLQDKIAPLIAKEPVLQKLFEC